MRCSSVGECGRRTTNMYSEDNFDLPPRVPHVPNATTAYLLGLGLMLWWYMAAVAHSAVVILGSRARNGAQQCVEHQWSTTKTGTSVPCKKCSIVFEIAVMHKILFISIHHP